MLIAAAASALRLASKRNNVRAPKGDRAIGSALFLGKAMANAAAGDYLLNGEETLARQQPDIVPETSVRAVEPDWD